AAYTGYKTKSLAAAAAVELSAIGAAITLAVVTLGAAVVGATAGLGTLFAFVAVLGGFGGAAGSAQAFGAFGPANPLPLEVAEMEREYVAKGEHFKNVNSKAYSVWIAGSDRFESTKELRSFVRKLVPAAGPEFLCVVRRSVDEGFIPEGDRVEEFLSEYRLQLGIVAGARGVSCP